MYIYAYECIYKELKGLLKIGQTTRTPEERVQEQIGTLPIINNVQPFKLVFYISDNELGYSLSDKEIHKLLKKYHVSKEWFKITLHQLKCVLLSIHPDLVNSGVRLFPHKRREIIYKGKKYSSLYELSQGYNISYNSLVYRIRKGLSIEQSIEQLLNKKADTKRLSIKQKRDKTEKILYNNSYITLRELASIVNIEENTFRSRYVSMGRDINKVMDYYLKSYRYNKDYIYNRAEWLNILNIPDRILCAALRHYKGKSFKYIIDKICDKWRINLHKNLSRYKTITDVLKVS